MTSDQALAPGLYTVTVELTAIRIHVERFEVYASLLAIEPARRTREQKYQIQEVEDRYDSLWQQPNQTKEETFREKAREIPEADEEKVAADEEKVADCLLADMCPEITQDFQDVFGTPLTFLESRYTVTCGSAEEVRDRVETLDARVWPIVHVLTAKAAHLAPIRDFPGKGDLNVAVSRTIDHHLSSMQSVVYVSDGKRILMHSDQYTSLLRLHGLTRFTVVAIKSDRIPALSGPDRHERMDTALMQTHLAFQQRQLTDSSPLLFLPVVFVNALAYSGQAPQEQKEATGVPQLMRATDAVSGGHSVQQPAAAMDEALKSADAEQDLARSKVRQRGTVAQQLKLEDLDGKLRFAWARLRSQHEVELQSGGCVLADRVEEFVRLWFYDQTVEERGEVKDNVQHSLLLSAVQIAEGQENPDMKFVDLCRHVMGVCAPDAGKPIEKLLAANDTLQGELRTVAGRHLQDVASLLGNRPRAILAECGSRIAKVLAAPLQVWVPLAPEMRKMRQQDPELNVVALTVRVMTQVHSSPTPLNPETG